jgi:hypothetical protein
VRIRPDKSRAAQEQERLDRLVRAALGRVLHGDLVGEPDGHDRALLRHPAIVEIAHAAQRTSPTSVKSCDELADRLARALVLARAGRNGTASNCPVWSVELASPQHHLSASLTRAIAQIPDTVLVGRNLQQTVVTDWLDDQRTGFCTAARLLHQAWPQMLDELRVTVCQVALLAGNAVDGFTDFTIHGAVLINRRRLDDDSRGLPGSVRFAEALVHEGTHSRCNAAAVAQPVLRPATAAEPLTVMTPLRPDPRPLTGLFQQLVVLARCVLFYRRLLDSGVDGDAAVRARHAILINQVVKARDVLHRHRDQLTDAGCMVVAEADDVISRGA